MNNDNRIILGKLGAPYGIRGWLKVTSYTSPPENILTYDDWQVQHQNQWRKISVESTKILGNGIAVKLAGINDRDVAKLHTHNPIAIYKNQLPETEENEYYWHDLIGLEVTTTEGVLLGKIIEMRDTGANDIMIIKDKERRHLVPFIEPFLKSVDLDKKQIIVEWDHDF